MPFESEKQHQLFADLVYGEAIDVDAWLDELNADLDIYENDVLKQHKFDEFIERIGLSDVWPLTITGKYKTSLEPMLTSLEFIVDVLLVNASKTGL